MHIKKYTLKLIGMFGACLIVFALTSCSNNNDVNKITLKQNPNKFFVNQNTENKNMLSKETEKKSQTVPTQNAGANYVPIRVLAYNIRRGLGMDYKTDIKRVADAIKPLAPDLVALSEVDSNAYRSGGVKQAKYLGDAMPTKSAPDFRITSMVCSSGC